MGCRLNLKVNMLKHLQNYYEALRLETDAYDRSYILYNIGLIHTSNGDHARALDYYYQALERNPALPQALIILLLFIIIAENKHLKVDKSKYQNFFLIKPLTIGEKLFD